MTYKRTPNEAFRDQRKSAIRRGIGWHFTCDEWKAWWHTQLGQDWFAKRGHKTGQYVMARKGDVGPYHPANVRAALVEENHTEFNHGKTTTVGKPHRKRLADDTVIAIYKMDGNYNVIADHFGLDAHTVHRVKCQKCYARLTDGLEKGRHG